MVRYSAMTRERIAGAIAPWAVATAAEVDAFVPNQGNAAAPGTTIPGLGTRPKVPTQGRRGARAFGENGDELEALRRARDEQRKTQDREEEQRAVHEAERQRAASGAVRRGRDARSSGGGGDAPTTAPKMSTRRAARLAAAEKENRAKEL